MARADARSLQKMIDAEGGDGTPGGAFAALREIPRRMRRRTLVIEKIDGRPAADSPMLAELLESGFVIDYRGIAAEAFP